MEAPVVAVGTQGQAENAERVVPPHLAVGASGPRIRAGRGRRCPPRTPPSPPRPWVAPSRAGGEALVAVLVSVQHDVDARVLQDLPGAGNGLVVAPLVPGGEPRSMNQASVQRAELSLYRREGVLNSWKPPLSSEDVTWRRSTSAAITSTFQVSKRCGFYPCPVVDTAGSTVVPQAGGVLLPHRDRARGRARPGTVGPARGPGATPIMTAARIRLLAGGAVIGR